ncbi:NAD(P)H-dependent oxidoreductase [Steroidobacter sp. S1-65]|uniref:NAD(P)H-dependent oxidoreductase n=1 Tax=Steroidobacter gossypii TaxID=2805490 RepID=A0ABS1WQH6_9GAMM|nr:NAD(P)H-dependent oxidoreductase [Steroidobacter gossypii]MBM0103232.1 NAD(P)H-dependent oxidoreductase [Steroidobacter gossypii]
MKGPIPFVDASEGDVLAIAGSLRRDSFNRWLLNAAAGCAPDGMRLQIYDQLAALPMFDEDRESAALAAGPVRDLRDQVASASALLIATAEYNQSMPGVLKNAIDWLSRPAPDEVLVGKPVALIGASAGRWGTRLAQAALRQVLFATESLVLTGPALYLANAAAAFDADGKLVDPAAQASLRRVLLGLRKLIEDRARSEAPGR